MKKKSEDFIHVAPWVMSKTLKNSTRVSTNFWPQHAGWMFMLNVLYVNQVSYICFLFCLLSYVYNFAPLYVDLNKNISLKVVSVSFFSSETHRRSTEVCRAVYGGGQHWGKNLILSPLQLPNAQWIWSCLSLLFLQYKLHGSKTKSRILGVVNHVDKVNSG